MRLLVLTAIAVVLCGCNDIFVDATVHFSLTNNSTYKVRMYIEGQTGSVFNTVKPGNTRNFSKTIKFGAMSGGPVPYVYTKNLGIYVEQDGVILASQRLEFSSTFPIVSGVYDGTYLTVSATQ